MKYKWIAFVSCLLSTIGYADSEPLEDFAPPLFSSETAAKEKGLSSSKNEPESKCPPLRARSRKPKPCKWYNDQHPLIELKFGYFFFSNSKMNNVYNNGGIDVQLSGSYPVYSLLHVYGSFEFLQKSGHSQGNHQETSIWEIPLSLGLRPVLPIRSYVSYYLTFGPRYFFAHVHNNSSYVPCSMNANGCGFFANTGFLFTFYKHWVIDLFGEYSYGRLNFHSSQYATQGHTVQVGGWTFGGGFGYSF